MMDARLVDAVLTRIRATWPMANDIEITLEANPTSVEAGRFAGYRAAGVNRVSMGIQALNDSDLKALGRLHSRDEALRAFEVARGVFDRVSFDLIYARQGQTLTAWEGELREALGYAVDHLSLYQLTIEDGTAFGDRYAAGKLRDLPDDDLAADMYALTQDICAAAGFGGYEVSNHARSGCESVHNQIYWRYGDYAGIGPGAHGRLTLGGQRFATEAQLSPTGWLSQVRRTGNGDLAQRPLDAPAEVTERLLMGMRLTEGVLLERLDLVNLSSKINTLVEMGMVEITPDRLRATQAGRPVLNAVLRVLLDD
jgi:putative oxygen-independent coproporphyrinogen III oxidase